MTHQQSTRPLAAPTIAQLPVRLGDLLRREVCLDLSRAHIETALREVEREAEELQKTRPPFLFLQTKNLRSEFQARESGASESLAALRRGLENISRAQPQVRAWVEDDLETFLRDSQPSYINGLAAHSFADDWQRCILRFDQRVAGFRVALGALQSALGTVPTGTVLSSHANAFAALMDARQWGALLDYEYLFFNRIADQQRIGGDLGSSTLKRTPEHRFSTQVGRWAHLGGELVRRAILELRAQMELACMDARALYLSEAALASGSGPRSFVHPTWEALRQLMRIEIDPNQVEEIVAETERMVFAVTPQ